MLYRIIMTTESGMEYELALHDVKDRNEYRTVEDAVCNSFWNSYLDSLSSSPLRVTLEEAARVIAHLAKTFVSNTAESCAFSVVPVDFRP